MTPSLDVETLCVLHAHPQMLRKRTNNVVNFVRVRGDMASTNRVCHPDLIAQLGCLTYGCIHLEQTSGGRFQSILARVVDSLTVRIQLARLKLTYVGDLQDIHPIVEVDAPSGHTQPKRQIAFQPS